MATANIITEDLVRVSAPNGTAVSNARKISASGGFTSLYRTEDSTLIFGDCKGSGSSVYSTSADFSGEVPVFRCSCPSRQRPCKHCIAIMIEWLAGKEFTAAQIPEDIARKRSKLEEKTSAASDEKKTPKPNKAAAQKKLKKQVEGLELADRFVKDILSRGASSVNRASAEQYAQLAKQLGDYYLPEPQAIMTRIISAAQRLSEHPDDRELERIVSLCVRLSSTVKKSRDYINAKLESGEVLPEDNILYEAMGGVWKLTQLKEIGLFKENARIIQLSFQVIHDDIHKADIDLAYWIDLDTGEISKTENIRPLKAAKYIKAEDSVFGIHRIKELCYYPGGLNRRIRWESAEITEPDDDIYGIILSKSEATVADAVKKAKNELKNTLSDGTAALLVPFDRLVSAGQDRHITLIHGEETIALRSTESYPDTVRVLECVGDMGGGAILGELFYLSDERRFYLCPLSLITENGIIRLV